MKIVFTGGGTGGHVYPLIAIAEQVNMLSDERKLVESKLYYFSDTPYDRNALFENGIVFERIPAGKLRLYFSLKTLPDMIKTFVGVFQAILKLWSIYPDVVVGKGGYASFPTLLAARLLRIPVIIHESDSTPGRVNKWAGKFATKIALSFPEAASFFPKDKIAVVGLPIRKDILHPATEGALEYLKLEHAVPVVFILGGSQGAQMINTVILDALPLLLEKFQIIHQVGSANMQEVTARANVVLEANTHKARYKPFPFLNTLAMKMAAGAATVIITRGGSSIFEIANWGVPSIVIPISKSNGDHQRKNAYTYAAAGAADVVEENNLTPGVLATEIEKLTSSPARLETMKKAALAFARPDAAKVIAEEVVRLALSHEQ